MRFRYTELPGPTGKPSILEPVIRVWLVGPSGRFSLRMVVDSGAANTVVPALALRKIGVPISNDTVELVSFGGNVVARTATVRIEFGGRFTFSTEVASVEGTASRFSVLGSRDFFLNYVVTLAARDRAFVINPCGVASRVAIGPGTVGIDSIVDSSTCRRDSRRAL